ncbi:MAG TPA: SH3 domain-containing protein [Micropepsaceae bacterium]|nr:SH3 domain-containing protein [Micropepsaceae bacterium]
MRRVFVVCGFACVLSLGMGHDVLSATAQQASASPPASSTPAQPYFASLKGDKVFMREGPSDNHQVKWIYHRKGLPVEVLASFEVWRRVKDMDGVIGWIHQALLSRERTALVVGAGDAAIRKGNASDTAVVGQARPGAIGRLVACKGDACEVKFDGVTGWVERSRLWGVHGGENF